MNKLSMLNRILLGRRFEWARGRTGMPGDRRVGATQGWSYSPGPNHWASR